tara:strand:- start:1801 stop:2064 length:264 start_codon:yes stop_codon:yes gene_type:complete
MSERILHIKADNSEEDYDIVLVIVDGVNLAHLIIGEYSYEVSESGSKEAWDMLSEDNWAWFENTHSILMNFLNTLIITNKLKRIFKT